MGDNEYKQRHRDMGLCVECSEPVYPGIIRCLKHNRNHNAIMREFYKTPEYRERDRKRRISRKDNGKCMACGTPLIPEDNGCVTCQNCREKLYKSEVENAVPIV